MLRSVDPVQAGAKQRGAGQVERRGVLLADPAMKLGVALCLRHGAQVADREVHVHRGIHRLARLAPVGAKARAQGVMACVDGAPEPVLGGHVEQARGIGGRLQAPHLLLGERERDALAGPEGPGDQRRDRLAAVSFALHGRGQAGDRRGLEQGAQAQLHAEGLAHLGDDLDGLQRVASEVEEVVVCAEARDSQHARPARRWSARSGCGGRPRSLMRGQLGRPNKKARFGQMFSNSRAVNILAGARIFLFASRDVWFVVGLPVYLRTEQGWSFWGVGTFLAVWVIGYGAVQAFAPSRGMRDNQFV